MLGTYFLFVSSFLIINILFFSSISSSPFVDDEFYQEWSFDGDEDLVRDTCESSGSLSKQIYLPSIHAGTPYPIQDVTAPLLQDYRGRS